MARRRYGFDEARIRRFIRQGRGTGTGKLYKPWLRVSDVPSRGRVHRPYGLKAGREHHLLSDNEYYAYLLYEWDDSVTDIREQFPLIDRRETVEIAARCGVRHPTDPRSGALLVITTDLLLTVRTDNGSELVARTVKEAKDLADERTLEKLEIERRFWERREVPWAIITDLQVKSRFTLNLAWVFDGDAGHDDTDISTIDETVRYEIAEMQRIRPQMPIRLACSSADRKYGYSTGESLAALRRLLWKKHIHVDLHERHIQDLPVIAFKMEKGEKK